MNEESASKFRSEDHGVLFDIPDRLNSFLKNKTREIVSLIAMRAALRVITIVDQGDISVLNKQDSQILLLKFRSAAISWVAVRFLTLGSDRIVYHAAAAATAVAKASHTFFLNDSALEAAGRAAASCAALRATDAMHFAVEAAYAAINAAGSMVRTLAQLGMAITDADMVADDVATSIFASISNDVKRVETETLPSSLIEEFLWPNGEPSEIKMAWEALRSVLLASGDDWDVWVNWYEARLAGRVQSEERELAYVEIDEALWKQGPAVVNAEIKRRLEALSSSGAIDNVPSAVSFGWTSRGAITVAAGALNSPAFPFGGGEKDHKSHLDACRTLASGLISALARGKWNARADYGETLNEYVAFLPTGLNDGNFLLADAEARVIRAMFAAEEEHLPLGLAAKLKVLLEQHIGLRAYYPQTEAFYQSVRTGRLEQPLPIDAVQGLVAAVIEHTPSHFEPAVAETLTRAAQPLPAIAPPDAEAQKSEPAPVTPPSDPIGEIDPAKARAFTVASNVNALWKVVTEGKKAGDTVEGWKKTIETLAPYALPIIQWLRSFIGA